MPKRPKGLFKISLPRRPLAKLPAFLSSISMVTDDQEEGVRELIRAERPSPSVYAAAREHFVAALEKKLTVDQVFSEAARIRNPIARKYALEILGEAKDFLLVEPATRTFNASHMDIRLPNGIQLDITPVWVRDCKPYRLMILHFWKKALTELQIKAAAGILLSSIEADYKKYAGFELDFISIATLRQKRRFTVYGWDKIKPLQGDDLQRFMERLCLLWEAYLRRRRVT